MRRWNDKRIGGQMAGYVTSWVNEWRGEWMNTDVEHQSLSGLEQGPAAAHHSHDFPSVLLTQGPGLGQSR